MKETIMRTATFITLIMVLSGIGVLFTPASSSAAIPILWIEMGIGNFDQLQATSIDPVFAPPGMSDFVDAAFNPVPSWTGSFLSAYSVGASGDPIDDMDFNVWFDDAYEFTPFSFEFYAYDNGTLRDWATLSHDGRGITSYDNWTIEPHQLPVVPEPSTLLLLGSGLVGLIGFARRSRY